MEAQVYNIKGEKTSKKAKLVDEIFSIEPNDHAIYLDVKQYLANRRQGTHKAKERAEVAGSTRKIKKQKGTGTARAGAITNPLFVGGGRVFGPRPKDYSFKLNKKLKRLARKSALSYKVKSENLVVVEDFNIETPKTKEFTTILNNLKLSDQKILLVVNEDGKNIYLSARNIPKTKVVSVDSLNTYDIMNAGKLVLAEGTIEKIQNALNK